MIAVFSGTSDGRYIVEGLLKKGIQVICFNATQYGGSLYESHPDLSVYDHKMDKDEIGDTCMFHNVTHIVDCTHPYAILISENLMTVASLLKIPYLRYERPVDEVEGYDCYEDIVSTLKETAGHIFLTTGSNHLHYFADEELRDRVFCRVLPTVDVIEKCRALGFSPKQIIGMQGPFDQSLNEAMFKMLNIKHLVTKASGKAGGFSEKLGAAKALDIKVHILNRPKVNYGKVYETLNEILKEF